MFKFTSLVLVISFMLAFACGNVLANTSDVYIGTGQFFGGYVVGAASGVGLYYFGATFDQYFSFLDDEELWLLPCFGGAIAISITVYVIGQKFGCWDGSLGWTVIGSIAPVVIGALVGVVFLHGAPDGDNEWSTWTVLWQAFAGGFLGSLVSPIGAMIGYHSSKEKKQAAIDIEGEGVQLDMSHLRMQTNQLSNRRPQTGYTLRLVSIRF